MEIDETEFGPVLSSQRSLIRRVSFADPEEEETNSGGWDSPPLESTPILMVSPPSSPEPVDEDLPSNDIFQTPLENPLDSHQHDDSDRGLELSPQKRQKLAVEPDVGGAGPSRVLPPSIYGSARWGNGKWQEDARKKMKTKKIPLREVIAAIIRNVGETEEDRKIQKLTFVDIAKMKGIKFPD